MKLSTQTLLVPLCTVSLLVTGLYMLISRVTVNSFDELELTLLSKQVTRVENTIGNIIEDHSQKISDWAQWDNTFEFAKSLSQKYIDDNLNPETLTALGFNSVIYLTPQNDLLYGVQVSNGEAVQVDAELANELIELTAKSQTTTQGIFQHKDKLFLIAAAPILPNKGDLPPRGKLVATAEFGPETLNNIRYLTNLSITPLSVNRLSESLAPSSKQEGEKFKLVSDDLAFAYGQIKDLNNNPVFRFRVEDARAATNTGISVRNTASFVLLMAGGLAALFIAVFIKKFAVHRIEEFSRNVQDIWHSRNLGLRVNDKELSNHSLRVRTAAGIIGLFAISTLSAYIVLNNYFLKGFAEIERTEMLADLERGKRALLGRLEILKGKVSDWAQWDDTYQFVEDQNADYRTANLEFDTLGTMNLKYVLYFDTDHKMVLGRKVVPEKSIVTDVESSIGAQLSAYPMLTSPEAPVSGVISLHEGPVLVGASPILDTNRALPSRGGMVFGSSIDSALESDLSRQTRLELKFERADSLESANDIKIVPISEELLSGKIAIEDMAQRVALEIQVTSLRPIYYQGRRAAHLLPIYFALCGLVCTIITVLFVDRLLLNRVRGLGQDIKAIQSSTSDLGRVSVTGKDELSGLASNINRMLDALERAQVEVKIAKEVAEHANQAKSMFIARVSHELRTPVAGIIGLNDMLMKRVGEQRGVRELLNMQSVSAEGLLTIINEILDFSTIEQGKLTFENIEFEPRAIVKEALQTVTGRLLTKNSNTPLQLIIDIDPKVAKKLKGDPTKVKQILVNLIGNGIKFTQQGHVGVRVTVEFTTDNKQQLNFAVWDTGIGIPANKLASVFEPFTQADESVKRKFQGTGLGLAIVKQMTEGMGGNVSVESTEGSGSIFKVSIPFEVLTRVPYSLDHPGIWPATFAVVGNGPVQESVTSGLQSLGGKLLGVFNDLNPENILAIKAADLIVVLEEAASSTEFLKLVQNKSEVKSCLVPIISLAQGELRQKIHTLGVRTILSYPAFADDAVNALVAERTQAADDAAAVISRTLPTHTRPLKILIADDTLTNRIVLEDLLTEAGHTVVCVDDGHKLVERLRPMLTGESGAEDFDIVLTDISMPTMDGYSATEAIRALEQNSKHHIPIVAITAHILTEEQQRMRNSGMDDVLTKPIKPDAVAEVFNNLVKS